MLIYVNITHLLICSPVALGGIYHVQLGTVATLDNLHVEERPRVYLALAGYLDCATVEVLMLTG